MSKLSSRARGLIFFVDGGSARYRSRKRIEEIRQSLEMKGYTLGPVGMGMANQIGAISIIYPWDVDKGILERLILDPHYVAERVSYDAMETFFPYKNPKLYPIGLDTATGDMFFADANGDVFGLTEKHELIQMTGSWENALNDLLMGKERVYRSGTRNPVSEPFSTGKLSVDMDLRTLNLLRFAGWYPGYSADTSAQREILQKNGFVLSDTAEDFLSKFGNLVIVYPSDIERGLMSRLDLSDCNVWYEQFQRWEQIVKKSLCPVGMLRGQDVFMIAEDGTVYGGSEEQVYMIGETDIEAIENVLKGKEHTFTAISPT